MKKEAALNLIGLVFLLWGAGAILNTLFNIEQGLAPILWFSYIGLILLAIGVFRRDSYLIAAQLCILAIPYLFWNLDFFYYIFRGMSLFGIVDYFFASGSLIGKIISSQHLFNLPLSLIAIYLIGLKRKDFWKLAFFEVFVLFFITLLFTTYEQNVNCVYHNCARFDFGFYYPLQWFLAYFLMILASNFIILRLFHNRTETYG